MPLYDYSCPECGSKTTRLRRYTERDEPVLCTCGRLMERLFPLPHVGPDGMYSYAENVGSKDSFDRKMAKLEQREQTKRETGKVKLVDEV